MDKIDFKTIMERNNFRVEGKLAYGSVKGYPVLVKKKQGKAIWMYFYLEGDPWKEIRTELIEFAKRKKAVTYFENDQIVWKTGIKANDDGKLNEILEGIVGILQERGIRIPKKCVVCGNEPADAYAVIHEGNQPVHKECLQNEIVRVRKNMQRGTYLSGMIGGLLGCLVGCIPCVLSLLILGKTYCVLFLFIPPCIYYGYQLLRGKMNQMVFWLSVALSLFSVYVIQIAARMYWIFQSEGLRITWHNIVIIFEKLVQVKNIWGNMFHDASLDFVFALIGILINWELISQTNLKAEENILKVIDTVNYNPVAKK